MKILHVIAQKPDFTGSGVYLKNMMKMGYKKNYTQALIAAYQSGEALPNNTENDFLVEFDSKELPFNMPGMSDEMPYESTPYGNLTEEQLQIWNEAFHQKLIEAKEKFKPDLVLSHHLWLLTAKVRDVFSDVPVFAFCHGTGLRQLRKNKKFLSQVIPYCSRLDKIFALNEFQRNEIVELLDCPQKDIVVSGIGYDDDIFYPPSPDVAVDQGKDIQRIIYAGKISWAKGVASLFSVIEELNKTVDCELIIAGSGTDERLKQLAPSNTTFLGRVSQLELAENFRKGDLFVLPSFYEGLPLVVLEALATGLKVVTTDIMGVQNWLGSEIVDSGYIEFVTLPKMKNVDEPYPEEVEDFEMRLSQSIKNLLNKSADKSHISQLALLKSWKKVYQFIEEMYEEYI